MHDLDNILHIDVPSSTVRIVPIVHAKPAVCVLSLVLGRASELVLKGLRSFGEDLGRIVVVLDGVDEGKGRRSAEGEGGEEAKFAGAAEGM
jgi:hypothetical protein